MLRRTWVLACTIGGVWGAIHLLGMFVRQTTGIELKLAGEGALLAIPVGLVGAMAGAFLGGLLLPTKL